MKKYFQAKIRLWGGGVIYLLSIMPHTPDQDDGHHNDDEEKSDLVSFCPDELAEVADGRVEHKRLDISPAEQPHLCNINCTQAI